MGKKLWRLFKLLVIVAAFAGTLIWLKMTFLPDGM